MPAVLLAYDLVDMRCLHAGFLKIGERRSSFNTSELINVPHENDFGKAAAIGIAKDILHTLSAKHRAFINNQDGVAITKRREAKLLRRHHLVKNLLFLKLVCRAVGWRYPNELITRLLNDGSGELH